MTPEGKIKQQIKKLLDSYGDRLYRYMPVPSGYGKRTVDYLICFDGIFIALEAKAPGGKPTALQSNVLDQVRRAGGCSYVVHDEKSLEVFANFLHAISKERYVA